MESPTRTSRRIATAAVAVVAAAVLHRGARAQEAPVGSGQQMPMQRTPQTQVWHLQRAPLPVAPRPSNDPVDLLARATNLGFASGHHVNGVVRELDTNRPLARVWVIAAWESYSQSGYVCVDADTVQSDATGRFEFSTWRQTWRSLGSYNDLHLRLFVYQPGYELVRLERRQILLRKIEDSQEERLLALGDIQQDALSCPPYDQHDPVHDEHFHPLLIDMYAEVQALPDDRTPQGHLLDLLRKKIALTKPTSR